MRVTDQSAGGLGSDFPVLGCQTRRIQSSAHAETVSMTRVLNRCVRHGIDVRNDRDALAAGSRRCGVRGGLHWMR